VHTTSPQPHCRVVEEEKLTRIHIRSFGARVMLQCCLKSTDLPWSFSASAGEAQQVYRSALSSHQHTTSQVHSSQPTTFALNTPSTRLACYSNFPTLSVFCFAFHSDADVPPPPGPLSAFTNSCIQWCIGGAALCCFASPSSTFRER
jgi:hypothetical protein